MKTATSSLLCLPNHQSVQPNDRKLMGADPHQMRVAAFRAQLLTTPAPEIVDSQILSRGCFAIPEALYRDMCETVAQQFGVQASDVFVVGSAKLGFSIAQKYRDRRVVAHRYRPFDESSDIDIALVAPQLFDQIWETAFLYMKKSGPWRAAQDFEKYFFRGWIRPDKLPPNLDCPQVEAMRTFFGRLSHSRRYGDNHLSVGLYRAKVFLHAYQTVGVQECVDEERLKK